MEENLTVITDNDKPPTKSLKVTRFVLVESYKQAVELYNDHYGYDSMAIAKEALKHPDISEEFRRSLKIYAITN